MTPIFPFPVDTTHGRFTFLDAYFVSNIPPCPTRFLVVLFACDSAHLAFRYFLADYREDARGDLARWGLSLAQTDALLLAAEQRTAALLTLAREGPPPALAAAS